MKKLILPLIFASGLQMTDAHAWIIPKEAFTWDYNVKLIRMTRLKEEKVLNALELIRHVLTTEEFRNGILNHRFNGRRAFAENKGLRNWEIYQAILEGAESLNDEDNNTMDLEVQLYTDLKSKTVAYTWTNSPRIWLNTKYFNHRTSSKIAGTLVHEWLHKLGFGHEQKQSYDRKFSVPYAVGNLVSEIAEKIEGVPRGVRRE